MSDLIRCDKHLLLACACCAREAAQAERRALAEKIWNALRCGSAMTGAQSISIIERVLEEWQNHSTRESSSDKSDKADDIAALLGVTKRDAIEAIRSLLRD